MKALADLGDKEGKAVVESIPRRPKDRRTPRYRAPIWAEL